MLVALGLVTIVALPFTLVGLNVLMSLIAGVYVVFRNTEDLFLKIICFILYIRKLFY